MTPHIDPELLSAYLDDEVSATERAAVAAHLPTCPNCQRELAALRHVRTLMSAMPLEAIPRPFYINAAMVAPQTTPSRWARWRSSWGTLGKLASATVALLLIVVLVQQLGRGMGTDSAAMPEMAEVGSTESTVVVTGDSADIAMAESVEDESASDDSNSAADDLAQSSDSVDTALSEEGEAWDGSATEQAEAGASDTEAAASAAMTDATADETLDSRSGTPLRSDGEREMGNDQALPSAGNTLFLPILAALALLLLLLWLLSRRSQAP